MLTKIASQDTSALYDASSQETGIRTIIATTPETRSICNDPEVAGIAYTTKLRTACARILSMGDFDLNENATVVINILRGGLNYGLRDALSMAYGWNNHTTCFISAQRARDTVSTEEWHITENAYKKIYFPPVNSLVIGDVVATGTSLKYALNELINTAQATGTQLKNILFFTYGGSAAEQILAEVDRDCRSRFPMYKGTTLVFLEGCFVVPTLNSTLSIRLTGTDLVREGSLMAPEFIESQYEDPTYPIERCTIYDAGSRACWVREYADDVCDYWHQVLELASRGVTYKQYLKERFSMLDPERFGEQNLQQLALRQIDKMQKYLPGMEH